MKRKLLLSLLGILAGLPILARDFEYTYEGQTIVYTVLDEEAKTCATKEGSRYGSGPGNNISGKLVLPSNPVNGDVEYTLSSIGYSAFRGCSLTEVTIPNSVTSIGYRAFQECSGLTEVTIPNSVTIIDDSAFYGCSRLTEVTIPNSVMSIGEMTFARCSVLTEVTIPNSVTSIGYEAFAGCSGLGAVTIGNSVTSIGGAAFYGCSGLTEVTIPNSVTSIGESAFERCSSLTEVTIGNSVTSIGYEAFSGCSGLTEVTIPNSVTSIGDYAFEDCSGLTEITIPNSVTSIGDYAFQRCSALASLIISDGDTEMSIGKDTFKETKVQTLYVGRDWTGGLPISYNLTSLTIGDSVTTIGGSAFRGCRGLTKVTIPNSVTSIDNSAFSGCSSLTSFTISDGDTEISIGGDNFNDTQVQTLYVGRDWTGGLPISKNLTSLTIGDSVTTIGQAAFAHCSGLTEVTIPNSVTSIGQAAFAYCSGLTEVTILNSVTSIGIYAFYDCSGLTEVTIPNSVTSIGDQVFFGCNGLTSLTLSDGDTEISIGANTFGNTQVQTLYVGRDWTGDLPKSNYLTTLTIGNYVTRIGDSAFEGYSGLTEVTIGNSVTSLGESAFSGCSGLTEITIPNTVTAMGKNAFNNCGGLQKVNYSSLEHLCSIDFGTRSSNPLWCAHNLYIGENKIEELVVPTAVKDIKAYAFAGGNFTTVNIPNSVMTIGTDAFADCTELETVHFEDGTSPLDLVADAFHYYKDNKMYYQAINDLYLGRNIANRTSLWPKNLVIGNLVTEFYNFKGNSYLEFLTLGSGLTAIPADAFNGCSLREVVVPVNVTDIGKNAFANNKLTALSMGYKMANIGANAFDGNIVETVNVAAITPPMASYTSFSDYSGKLYVPAESVDDYSDSWDCWVRFTSYSLVDLVKIEGSTENISGNVGETVQLSVTLTPENISLPYVFWSSTNPEVATVDNDGLVTFVGGPDNGECKIIAETLYDTDKKATFKVNSISTGLFEIMAEEGFEEFGGTDVERAKDIFTLQGVCLKRNATKDDVDALAPGIYIIAGKKIIVK